MNKVTLTGAQLKVLADYIYKQGFTDQLVVMEILDHFACKVEEKLAEHPNYTLEQAMYLAYDDFGAKGFHPIAAEFENTIKQKYKKLLRLQMKKIFSSVYIVLFLVLGVCFYEGVYWSALHPGTDFAGANNFFFWAGIVYFGVFLLVRNKIFRKSKSLITGSSGTNSLLYTPFAINIIFPFSHFTGTSLVVYSIVCALFLVFLAAREVAMYRIIKVALADIKEMDDNYDAVLG